MLVDQFIAKILTEFREEGGPRPRMAHQTLRPCMAVPVCQLNGRFKKQSSCHLRVVYVQSS
jgi:hypothetical protein